MRRLLPAIVLFLAAGALSGCDEEKEPVPVQPGGVSAAREEGPAPERPASGKDIVLYAPPTDFSGASPEDASSKASELFDGALSRDPVAANGSGSASSAPGRGKRLPPYTPDSDERLGRRRDAVPPLPDDSLYSTRGAAGSARGAGETLLGFAAFQLERKFPAVAPIMSRLGWKAAPRLDANEEHAPYRVTVHHTQGVRPMSEAETAAAVKAIQSYHLTGRDREGKPNFSDIGYHFLIAGDGRVVEGRHAEYIGAHVAGGNGGNIGVAMMGDFNKLKPTAAQIESLTRLVTFLAIKYKKEPADTGFLEGHQHYNHTECPGRNMMAIMDALRRKIDHEKVAILSGAPARELEDFQPLSVLDPPSA